jgi:hypothetical protein
MAKSWHRACTRPEYPHYARELTLPGGSRSPHESDEDRLLNFSTRFGEPLDPLVGMGADFEGNAESGERSGVAVFVAGIDSNCVVRVT